jgi:hypothetical protein
LFFLPLRFPAWMVLGFYFVLQWLYFQGIGVNGDANVAYSAHLVGFATGFLYTWALYHRRRRRAPARPPAPEAPLPVGTPPAPVTHTLPSAPAIPPPPTYPPPGTPTGPSG